MVFARCLKTLLKLNFRYGRHLSSQQQTRLEQLRAYSGEKLETGYVTSWGMYETERQKQIERDIEREFSLKGNVQQKTRK